MVIRFFVFTIFILSFCNVQGQQFEYKLGDVTVAELEQKKHPIDESAPAAILFSKGETYMMYQKGEGFKLVTEVDMKIKIYNKDGYSWANKAISYYDPGSNRETVDISKAYTYNLEDGKVKKARLKNEGEFTEEVNKYWKVKKIVMPEVKEGSIVEYRYMITSPLISSFPEWRFQEEIPVNHSMYTTKIPEYFNYTPNFRGYYIPKVSKKTTSKNIAMGGSSTASPLNYQEAVTTYELTDVPAMKDESFINTIDNYISSIEHEITMISYPNEPIQSFSTTWEAVAKTIYENDNFGNELNKTGYFEDDIAALLSGITKPEEKMNAVYNFVKNRMNWNEYYGYSSIDGVRKAYKEKVGNIADINLMLTAMLRYAGLDANPVLVTTRSSKIALFPNRTAFNYVVSAVQLGEDMVLLDATSKSALPSILPFRALNWTGRLIKKDGTSQAIEMIPKSPSMESVSVMATLDQEGNLSGQVKEQYYDYNAYAFREGNSTLSNESNRQRLEKKHNGIAIEEYSIEGSKDLAEPVAEKYDFTHNGIADIIGDKIYINPLLFFSIDENPFKQEKREYPIDFVYPRQDRFMINITLPDGYAVESVPEPASIAMEQGIAGFTYNIVASGNRIQLRGVMQISYATIPQDYYGALKDFFQKVIEKQGEKIVIART